MYFSESSVTPSKKWLPYGEHGGSKCIAIGFTSFPLTGKE
jgi:hypothetical protein